VLGNIKKLISFAIVLEQKAYGFPARVRSFRLFSKKARPFFYLLCFHGFSLAVLMPGEPSLCQEAALFL